MSTLTSEARNEIDDEPEEGEIQDDEGSLEDVSSDDEIPSHAKRRESGVCIQTLVSLRGQFVKKERRVFRREMRLCSSERADPSSKKSQNRSKSGCRTSDVLDSYYASGQRHKSSKEHSQKGKIHEKENKAKDSKKTYRRSMSFHGYANEPRGTYLSSECVDSYISSPTSSKGSSRKSDVKEKHKKKKKNNKMKKFLNPLGEVCASQMKSGRLSACEDSSVKSGMDTKDESAVPQKITEGGGEKSMLGSPSSPSSDIQVLEVPVIVPEVITICDSDDDNVIVKYEISNCNINFTPVEGEADEPVTTEPTESIISPVREVIENDDGEDTEENLKLLREAALKSSKPEVSSNVHRDDEVLQLRLAALRSAIIRKYEERKKRGITLAKKNKKGSDKQMMSISPLGSPNYYSSADNSVRVCEEIDHDLCCFEFGTSSNQCGVSEPLNECEVDKISTIDMELAESDDEKEHMYREVNDSCREIMENFDSERGHLSKVEQGPLEQLTDEVLHLYPIDEHVGSAIPQNCELSAHSPSICSTNVISGYIIGDEDQEQSVFGSEMLVSFTLPVNKNFDTNSEATQTNGVCTDKRGLEGGGKIQLSDQRPTGDTNCEQVVNVLENVIISEYKSKSSKPLEIDDLKNVKFKNDERIDTMSNRGDCGFLSPGSGELDLDSMIVLDEVGKCSDDATSECSVEEVVKSVKFRSSVCDDIHDISEMSGNENIPKVFEKSSDVNISNVSCNSRSFCGNVPTYSNNFEECGDNSQMFNENSQMNILSDITNSRSPVSVNLHKDHENSEICGDNEGIPHSVLILNTQSPGSDVTILENVSEAINVQVSDRGDTVALRETSNLSSSDSPISTETKVPEYNSESVSSLGALDNQQNILKFSSEENERFLVSPQPMLTPDCKEIPQNTGHDSLTPNDIKSSVDKLLEVDHMLITSDASNVENVSNNHETLAEDEESILRGNLLAMLKKKPNEQSDKLTLNSDLVGPQDEANFCDSSMVKDRKTSESVLPVTSQVASQPENVMCEDTDKNTNSLLKERSLSCSPKIHQSSIQSLTTSLYPVRHSPSLTKRGAKSNKCGSRESKVPGRFNVNVPKLVINLGEDSDSGDDDVGSEVVKSMSLPKLNGNNLPEETKEETKSSKSVPPDFEKKLDMLLKQARIQQETTNDDKELSSENADLENSNLVKATKLPTSSSSVNVGKNSKNSVSSGNPTARTKSLSKLSPLALHGSNQLGKATTVSMLSRDNTAFSGNNINLTKTSTGKTIDAYKRDSHGRIKSTSTVITPSSSVSSVVDIRLLPSSKQKEYIRLKRQLAQLARKEQGTKSKENVIVMDTTRLPVRKSGLEETKVPVSVDVRNSTVKTSGGIFTERTPFSRKYVRRGQGGNLISRTDLKSRRITRTISSFNSQTNLRNKLTVTTPNKVGGPPLDGSSIVRRVSCVPQKKIVTALNSVKKVPSGIQTTTPNISASTGDKQKKLANIVNKSQAGRSSILNVSRTRVKSDAAKTDGQETKMSDCVEDSENGEICIEQTVIKRIGIPLHLGEELKKCVVDQELNSNNAEGSKGHKDHSDDVDCNENNCDGFDTLIIKRKRDPSADEDVSVRKKAALEESTRQQTDVSVGSNFEDSTKLNIVDRTLAESLWKSESKLISKRYQVLEDIACVHSNLHEIERVNKMKQQIIRNIQKLKDELKHTETQLNMEEKLLLDLYSDVENAKRDIMRKQSETLLLSVECEEMGGKVHGSNYSVPNTCTDLIRHGMTTISKTLQRLKDGRSAVESKGETSLSMSDTTLVNTSEIPNNTERSNSGDSSKQIPKTYSSPLEAMKKATETSQDNQAVLCPYHIMGTCKDKECSYLH